MHAMSGKDRSHYPPIRKFALDDPEANDDDLSASTTVEQRLAIMWPIAQAAWAFMGEPQDAARLQRHIESIQFTRD